MSFCCAFLVSRDVILLLFPVCNCNNFVGFDLDLDTFLLLFLCEINFSDILKKGVVQEILLTLQTMCVCVVGYSKIW